MAVVKREDYFLNGLGLYIFDVLSLLKGPEPTTLSNTLLWQHAGLDQEWIAILVAEVDELVAEQLVEVISVVLHL